MLYLMAFLQKEKTTKELASVSAIGIRRGNQFYLFYFKGTLSYELFVLNPPYKTPLEFEDNIK